MDCLTFSLKEHIFNQKCFNHPHQPCNILNFDPYTNQHRVCSLCVQEQKISNTQLMYIGSLLNMESFKFHEDIEELLNSNIDFDTISKEVEIYFLELQNKLQKALNRMFDNERQRVNCLIKQWNNSKEQFRKLFSIDSMRKIFDTNEGNQEQLLHEFIVENSLKYEAQIEDIKQQVIKIDKVQSQYSLEIPHQIQNNLLKLIDQINLFCGDSRSFQFPKLLVVNQWENSILNLKQSQHFKDSVKDLQFETNLQGKQIIHSLNSSEKQCYLMNEILPNKKYIIRLQLNNVSDNLQPNFKFGLVPSSQKDNNFMWKYCNTYYSQINGGATNKIVRGNKLESGWQRKQIGNKNLEFRVCVQDRYWRISDYPEYNSVLELDDCNYIDPNQIYNFGITIFNKSDQVIIQEVIEVSSFDHLM